MLPLCNARGTLRYTRHCDERTRSYSPGRECRLVRGRKGKPPACADSPEIPSLIVALSGGADSAYLAWATHEALGTAALSITALSPSTPRTIAPLWKSLCANGACDTNSSKRTRWRILLTARTPPTGVTSAKTSCFPPWMNWHTRAVLPPSPTVSTPMTRSISPRPSRRHRASSACSAA